MKFFHQAPKVLAALALVTLLAGCYHDRYGFDRDRGEREGGARYGDHDRDNDEGHNSSTMGRDDHGNRR